MSKFSSFKREFYYKIFIYFRAFPGIFGNQAEQLTQIIHQIFLNCLNDQDTKVRYTAATALAAYLKHNSENTQLLNIYRDCLPCLISVCIKLTIN